MFKTFFDYSTADGIVVRPSREDRLPNATARLYGAASHAVFRFLY